MSSLLIDTVVWGMPCSFSDSVFSNFAKVREQTSLCTKGAKRFEDVFFTTFQLHYLHNLNTSQSLFYTGTCAQDQWAVAVQLVPRDDQTKMPLPQLSGTSLSRDSTQVSWLLPLRGKRNKVPHELVTPLKRL